MPPGLKRYWAAKKKAKKARSAPRRRKATTTRVRRTHGPTRRTIRRDVTAHHRHQVQEAKHVIKEAMAALRSKERLLKQGLTGRAGRRK